MEIKTKDFKRIFSVCRRFISTKRVVDWTANFIFARNYVYATNLSNGIYYFTDYDFGDGFMLPAADVATFFQNLDSETCTLTETPKKVKFETGKTKVYFQKQYGMAQVSFVQLPTDPYSPIDSEMWELVEKAKFSIGEENTNYELTGVYLHNGSIYSSNGKTATRIDYSDEGVDAYFPKTLIKILDDIAAAPVGISQSDTCTMLAYEKFTVFSQKLMSANSLPLEILDARIDSFDDGACVLKVDLEEMKRAVRRVSALVDPEGMALSLDFDKTNMKIHSHSERGQIEEEIAIESNMDDGATISVEMNARYLLNMLKLDGELRYMEMCFRIKNENVSHIVQTFVPLKDDA